MYFIRKNRGNSGDNLKKKKKKKKAGKWGIHEKGVWWCGESNELVLKLRFKSTFTCLMRSPLYGVSGLQKEI